MPRSKRNYVLSIAGDRYGRRPDDDHTEASDALRALIQKADIASMTWRQLDQLERCAAALMGVIRTEEYRRHGMKQRVWNETSPAPGAKRVHFGHGYHGYMQTDGRVWIDHPYILHYPPREDGRKVKAYVSEPYRVFSDGVKRLAELVDEGWSVDIGAERALHFPGHTVQIKLTKRPKEQAE